MYDRLGWFQHFRVGLGLHIKLRLGGYVILRCASVGKLIMLGNYWGWSHYSIVGLYMHIMVVLSGHTIHGTHGTHQFSRGLCGTLFTTSVPSRLSRAGALAEKRAFS